MNLLIIPSWYDTPDNPVRGIFFKEQAQALSEYFKANNIVATVTILALQQYNIREAHLYKNVPKITVSQEAGITTIRSRFFHIPKVEEINLRRGAAFLKKLISYAGKVTGLEFSLIHIHSVQFSGIWYALSGLKIPYVITEHSSAFFRNRIGKTEKKYLPLVFDNARHVIAVGNGLAQKIQPYSRKNVEVVFNIVKDVPFSEFEHLKQDQRFIFFSLGYDIKVKGFDILINAFSKYLQKESGVLMLGGLTEESQKLLKDQAQSLGIQDNLILMGRIEHNEVYKLMKQSSCFVLPSRFETFGIVLAESMYVGRPVIASRTGGPDSFVSGDTGILVEPGNEEQLVDALIEMKENYSKYNQEQIRKYALNTFTANVICDKLNKIYENTL
ncbi:MAG: glycosyltransferase [Treponema sp.]|uniref:glycosyltransferase n=1 Tax=Treponema sp. TaxID=166 RepID=UPI0025D73C9E|nr:glycosyltransferase [Treponema sp.]MBQ8679093.1 glycosyltransferase [Treponema sp.]